MKSNVKLEKVTKGYFLTVSDEYTENRWAISSEELLLIWAIIRNEVNNILKED